MGKLIIALLLVGAVAFVVGVSGLPGPAVTALMEWLVNDGWIHMDAAVAERVLTALA